MAPAVHHHHQPDAEGAESAEGRGAGPAHYRHLALDHRFLTVEREAKTTVIFQTKWGESG